MPVEDQEAVFREVLAKALHIQQMDQKITQLEAQVESLRADREKAMRWGIMSLGAAVLGLGTWIFNFITHHLPKG